MHATSSRAVALRHSATLPVHANRLRPCRADPQYNPQNVDNPKVMPNARFSPQETVKVQIEACAANDKPWGNHGIQTMYEFAEDAGSMDRSRYFGFEKDLYHMDHFMGGFSTRLGAFLDCQSYKILEQRDNTPQPGMVQLDVSVVDRKGDAAGVFTFTLVQRELGSKKGCWMTKQLVKKAA